MISKHIIKGGSYFSHSLVFLLILLEIEKVEACTLQCVDTSNSCSVCFQVCQQQVSQFHNCSQTISDAFNQTSVFIYNEPECSQKCCSSQLSVFGLQKFSQCQDKEKIKRIQSIVIGCVMTVLVISFCICCCNKKVREKIAGCLCPENIKENDEQIKKENHISHEVLDIPIKQLSQQVKSSILLTEKCSICLKSSCNAITECGHCFHMNCLVYSYSKSKECPQCQRCQIQVIRLYCDKCHIYLGRNVKLSIIEAYEMHVNRESICENCSF